MRQVAQVVFRPLYPYKVSTGDFCVKLHIKCKRDGFEWVLVPVYGAAQNAHKPEFLAELVRTCEDEILPMLVGGDFNIIRKREEKIMIILRPIGLLSLMQLLNT
jgi:hypothetical protein